MIFEYHDIYWVLITETISPHKFIYFHFIMTKSKDLKNQYGKWFLKNQIVTRNEIWKIKGEFLQN